MITEEVAKKQLKTLHKEGSALAEEFGAEQERRRKLYGIKGSDKTLTVRILSLKEMEKGVEEPAPEPPPVDETHFEEHYQSWYSRALPLMKQLASDRYAEFQSFYLVDPRYPWGDTEAYVIQDYFRGKDSDAAGEATTRCFKNQLAILKSVADRLAWMSLDTEDQAERGMQLALLDTARGLIEVNERAAGALAGTVLEAYLRKLAAKHQVKLRKQSPLLNELADALKAAKVFDVPAWSQLSWLADLRSRCLKAEGEAPTKLQIRDLIDGTRWLITNIF